MKKLTLISAILLTANLLFGQYIKIDASFYSPALDEIKMIDILLPSDYYSHPEQQYAVIYYLHGANGDQNTGTVEANLYYSLHYQDTTIASPPAIFVRPDGSCEPFLGSLYLNSELYGNYEEYIMQDVIGLIEANFRAIPNKNFRFITGLSMGGFGSAWIAASYPEMFRATFPYIGFLAMPDTILNNWKKLAFAENGSYNLNYYAGPNTQLFFTMCGGLSPNLNIEPYHLEIPFDTLGNWVDTILNKWYKYDVSRKLKDLPDENELAWFLGCGTTDYMCTYPAYQVFMDSLDYYGIGYDYRYFEGGHVLDPETWCAGMHWMDSIINQSYQTLGIEITNRIPVTLAVFPNPVSDQLKITYHLNEAGLVKIEINNLHGLHMALIEQEQQQPGEYLIERNIATYPPGIYFIRLQTEKGVDTQKIIKVK
jgi:enterochelin esterase-like enzyme